MKLKFFISMILVLFVFPHTTYAQFSDIDEDFLDYLYEQDIFEGYPDGTFKPEQFLNRAELLKIVMIAGEESLVPPEDWCFPDVPIDEWFNSYVCTAKDNQHIHGYPDGSFKPAEYVNKVEALKIIANIVEWEILGGLTDSYSDTYSNQWYFKYVSNGLFRGYLDSNLENQFFPANAITRYDAAEILFRTLVDKKLGHDLLKNDVAKTVEVFLYLEALSKSYEIKDMDKTVVHGNFEYGYKIFSESQTSFDVIFLYKYTYGTTIPLIREYYVIDDNPDFTKDYSFEGIDDSGITIVKSLNDEYSQVQDVEKVFYSLDLDDLGTTSSNPLNFRSDFFNTHLSGLSLPVDLSSDDFINYTDPNPTTENQSIGFKITTALYMLGYTYYDTNNRDLHLELLEKYQEKNGFEKSSILTEEVAKEIDWQLSELEDVFDGYANKFYPLFLKLDENVEQNLFPKDYIAWIFIYPMEVLPVSLQIETEYEMRICIEGQCVGSVDYVNGVNIFNPDVFYDLTAKAFPKHASAQVQVVLHEYAHYLDAHGRTPSNNQTKPHANMLDTYDFFNISFDFDEESMVWGDVEGSPKKCYPLKNDLNGFIAYYGFDGAPGVDGECPEGYSSGPFEDFAQSFTYYVMAGHDFRKAGAQNSIIKEKYDWLKLNVFEGIEYDTEMVDINDLYSGCLDGDNPFYGPGYISCDDDFVWNGELRIL
ncbi:S-layer homology domain-containing protein [Patescibacteria group bacterium]